MGITALTGPTLTFGQALTSSGAYAEYNEQAGPNLNYQGAGILDPRVPYTYQPGAGVDYPVKGWLGLTHICVIDQVPTTAGENTIALTQSATTTTTRTLTLTTSNTANVTVNQSVVDATTGQTVTGLLAIDGPVTSITYGSAGTISLWDPASLVSRTVRIEGSSDDSGGGFTVNGYDIYGYPMTETLAGSISTTAGSTFVATRKAFKYIASITASGTVNSTGITIGVTDVFGFPLYVDQAPFASIAISSGTSFGLVVSSTGITVGSTAATQTSTTPDVRGTWSSTTASDGTRRITMFITPNPSVSAASSGLVGATQA